jgi:hypothetical protein
MRFPSVDLLAARALAVLRRFPWVLLTGAIAAGAGIVGSTDGSSEEFWARVALVAALGLPATIALTLLAEERQWGTWTRALLPAAALALLGVFLAVWPGIEEKHHAIRYVQLSAALHLAVAFLPFLGTRESVAFWQYNRRLFLGFLRAVVFSAVLFVGLAIALGALDKLFGVDVEQETYFRIWLVVAFVVNTWIFLAAVPRGLGALEHDAEYPRGLKIFAQYILTPLVFTYLIILLAYLVKIVAGAEWPSGWIGWLVTSVAVSGFLGFLLVHPLRADPEEEWIRTYARWLFIGLIPAALMLLVAFWKRILPYGITEPRMLGLLLGLWLLGIAVLFTVRPATGIRTIPVTLSLLLLLTLYGPVSATSVSLDSQSRRFARMLETAGTDPRAASEASAALRFLLDHRAADAIASAVDGELPPVQWDSLPRYGEARDSIATRIMALAGAKYVPQYQRLGDEGQFHIGAENSGATRVTGYDWLVSVSSGAGPRMAGMDSVRTLLDSTSGVVRIAIGADTFAFDLVPFIARIADSIPFQRAMPSDRLWLSERSGSGRAALRIDGVSGRRVDGVVRIDHWNGTLIHR